ncbi:MAG: nicotinate-nicotinamide nucleotide adenylyltransferase [Gaiellaceae bacterium]
MGVLTGLYGGAFDPPHLGHVEVLRSAKQHFGLERLVVLVSATPGHKAVVLDASTRLELARAAFPHEDVRLDGHRRTIDMLRDCRWDDPLFLIGADEFCDFPSWKQPEEVLKRTRLAVATRPGFPRERIESVLEGLGRRDRVLFFEIEPHEVASREIRARAAAGAPLAGLVPAEVERLIAERGLYDRKAGLHSPRTRRDSRPT